MNKSVKIYNWFEIKDTTLVESWVIDVKEYIEKGERVFFGDRNIIDMKSNYFIIEYDNLEIMQKDKLIFQEIFSEIGNQEGKQFQYPRYCGESTIGDKSYIVLCAEEKINSITDNDRVYRWVIIKPQQNKKTNVSRNLLENLK